MSAPSTQAAGHGSIDVSLVTHVVRQGEHISAIAERYGFVDFDTIWSAPENAALRALRPNPHVLFPGDEIFIPGKEEKSVDATTGRQHRFVLNRRELALRIVLRDIHGAGRAGVACTLDADGAAAELVTDGDGLVERPIGASTVLARLLVDESEIPVRIGDLDPVTEPSGLHARLHNLGYYRGVLGAPADNAQRLALEELQLELGLPVTGEADDATRAKILEVHGS